MHRFNQHEKLQTLDVFQKNIPLPAKSVINLDFGILAYYTDASGS